MKINGIKKVKEINYYIETDADMYPTFRRGENGGWERLMGESWESIYGDSEKELEKLFEETQRPNKHGFGPPKIPIEKRFWNKVDRREDNECWEWIGAKHKNGYGIFGHPAGYAHRVSWELSNGEIPRGLLVCHTCDNPNCVNPNHLFVATQSENMLDKVRKGRCVSRLGEKSHLAKLKENEVIKIKDLLKSKKYFDREIAKMFHVTVGCIQAIKKGNSWTWLK